MAEYYDFQFGEPDQWFYPQTEFTLNPEDLLVLAHQGEFDQDGAGISYITQRSDGTGTIGHVANTAEPSPIYTGEFTGLSQLVQSSSSNPVYIQSDTDLDFTALGSAGSTLRGASGNQTLHGGDGADHFVVQSVNGLYTGDDTFLNFDPLQDTIAFGWTGDFDGGPANDIRVDTIEEDGSTRYSLQRQDGEAGYTEIGSLTVDAVGLPAPGWFEIG